MRALVLDCKQLDLNAINSLGLSEEILMENAANALASFIRAKFKKGAKILSVAGSGNNAADSLVALRMLQGDYECVAYLASPNSPKIQAHLQIASKLGVKFYAQKEYLLKGFLNQFDCIIDGLFGTGLNRPLSEQNIELIHALNAAKAYKLACDMPSGLSSEGVIMGACFRADTTICMGALKLGLFLDMAKDFTGKI